MNFKEFITTDRESRNSENFYKSEVWEKRNLINMEKSF